MIHILYAYKRQCFYIIFSSMNFTDRSSETSLLIAFLSFLHFMCTLKVDRTTKYQRWKVI